MIRKEPKHAREQRERNAKFIHSLHPKKRKRRKSRRMPKPPTWEQAEIARLKHDKRMEEDLKLNRFFGDIFNTQFSERAMVTCCEITERGQIATLAIPMRILREMAGILKERVGALAGRNP